MKNVYIFHTSQLKKFLTILTLSLFTAILLITQFSLSPLTVSNIKEPHAIFQVKGTEKHVSLTFDISWGDKIATSIVEELQNKGIEQCTFFLSASWAERHPHVVEKIQKAGYEIGSLGYQYTSYTKLSREEIDRDISRSIYTLEKLGIKNIKLLRPPNGALNKDVLELASQRGLTVVHWSLDSKDWLTPGIDKIIENSTNSKEKGNIILLHASDSALQTRQSLSPIIQDWRNRGFSFVSVSQLISNSSPKAQIIE